jgi:ribosomal protein S27E
MSFGIKEKSSKKRIHVIDDSKETNTLDAIHIKTISKYNDINIKTNILIDDISNYENIQINILNEINNINNMGSLAAVKNNISQNLWNSNVQLLETIKFLKDKKKLLDISSEINYFENTGSLLFDYYNIIDKNLYTKSLSNPIYNKTNTNTNNILDALNIINEKPIESNKPKIDKLFLVNKYLALTNNKYVNHIDGEFSSDKCPNCENGILTNVQFDAIVICMDCGYQTILLAEQNRPVIMHNIKDTSHYSYKRINHFREWCNQVQGKESTEIPNDVFEKILAELKKQKIYNPKTISYKIMRNILKSLKLHKYYEHLNYIINRINGVQAPQFSNELEDKLCNMFKDIQGPFLKHCPKNRKNFLSYSYVLYKFFQILNFKEYLHHFPLLKSRLKIFSMDQIWINICKECNYTFIPSL